MKMNRSISRGGVFTFLVCLLMALGGWFFLALNQKYTYTRKAVLAFYNGPDTKAYRLKGADTMLATFSSNGWQLVLARLKINEPVLNIDLAGLAHDSVVVLGRQKDAIRKRLDDRMQLLGWANDTLRFDFSTRKLKRVPIITVLNLAMAPQHGVFTRPVTNVKYATITGDAETLKEINYIYADTVKAAQVAESFVSRAKLVVPQGADITVKPAAIDIAVGVYAYTEKHITVPIGLPDNRYRGLQLLPNTVELTVQLPIAKYNQAFTESFAALADINYVRQRSPVLPVQVTRKPEWCKIVHVEPQEVDYLIAGR